MPRTPPLPTSDEHSDEDSLVGRLIEQIDRTRRAEFLRRADAIAERSRGRAQVDSVELLREDRER